MKKALLLASCLMAACISTKAQIRSIAPSALDTVKTWSIPLGKLQADTNLVSHGLLNKFNLQHFEAEQYNLPLPQTGRLRGSMPVLKVASTDRMPVKYLGDTDKMHYTMLVKPVAK